MNSNLLSVSKKYIEKGLTIIPVNGKKPIGKWKEFETRQTNDQDLYRWSLDASITGLALIPKDGLVVIDLDSEELFIKFQELNSDELEGLPIQKSGKGYHIAFRCDELPEENKENLKGIDIIRNNAYVLVAPSLHPSGVYYEAFYGNFYEVPNVNIDVANYLLNNARELGQAKDKTQNKNNSNEQRVITSNNYLEGLKSLPGASDLIARFNQEHSVEMILERSGKYTKIGKKYLPTNSTSKSAGGNILEKDGKQFYYAHNGSDELNNDKPNDAFELFTMFEFNGDKSLAFRSLIERYGQPVQPVSSSLLNELNESSNADLFVSKYRDTVIYSKGLGWLVWDGKRWQRDDKDTVKQKARIVGDLYKQAIMTNKDYETQKKVLSWSKASLSNKGLESLLAIAQTDDAIRITENELDKDLYLLNLKNGTYDLRNMTFREHQRNDLITKVASVSYDSTAYSSKWLEFQKEICNGDEDLIRFKQVMYGAALSGLDLQAFFILYGSGANGKSTELNVIREILGDYSDTTNFDTFTSDRNNAVMSELARFKGVRFLSASESNEGEKFNSSIIKIATGGEYLIGKFSHKDTFSYKPHFKMYLATNHKPRIEGTDLGIWRRVKLVPYTVTIPSEKQNSKLTQELLEESQGILNWLIEGFRMFQDLGYKLPACKVVEDATKQYQSDEDVVLNFIRDMCEIGNDYEVSSKDVYSSFSAWQKIEGQRPMTQTKFGSRLDDLGYKPERKRTGKFRLGLRLLTSAKGDSLPWQN
jgi:putative DNA primase/helicase